MNPMGDCGDSGMSQFLRQRCEGIVDLYPTGVFAHSLPIVRRHTASHKIYAALQSLLSNACNHSGLCIGLLTKAHAKPD